MIKPEKRQFFNIIDRCESKKLPSLHERLLKITTSASIKIKPPDWESTDSTDLKSLTYKYIDIVLFYTNPFLFLISIEYYKVVYGHKNSLRQTI